MLQFTCMVYAENKIFNVVVQSAKDKAQFVVWEWNFGNQTLIQRSSYVYLLSMQNKTLFPGHINIYKREPRDEEG